jgi:hypothetical protein
MIKAERERIQAMAKQENPIPKFMKCAGSISGPADLSSRRGYSRGVDDRIVADKTVAEKVGFKRAKKARCGKTWQGASLQ